MFGSAVCRGSGGGDRLFQRPRASFETAEERGRDNQEKGRAASTI